MAYLCLLESNKITPKRQRIVVFRKLMVPVLALCFITGSMTIYLPQAKAGEDWMDPGKHITWDYISRNVTGSSDTQYNFTYSITVLENNNTHFIIEEKQENETDSDWNQRRYDPDDRESLTFPGNYSWHWIHTNVSLNDSVQIGTVNFTVTGIYDRWEFRGQFYSAIKVNYSVANLSAEAFYNKNTTLLLYANVTVMGTNYTNFMEYFFDSMTQLKNWPPPLQPPGGRSSSKNPVGRSRWGAQYFPPWYHGSNIVDTYNYFGLARITDYRYKWPDTGRMRTQLIGITGVAGSAYMKTVGAMVGYPFLIPEDDWYKSFSGFDWDGWFGWSIHTSIWGLFGVFEFWSFEVKVSQQHELYKSPAPIYIITRCVYEKSAWGWWLFGGGKGEERFEGADWLWSLLPAYLDASYPYKMTSRMIVELEVKAFGSFTGVYTNIISDTYANTMGIMTV